MECGRNPVVGKQYWTIHPVTESQGDNAWQEDASRPYQVWCTRGGIWSKGELIPSEDPCSWDFQCGETLETVDDDANASFYVYSEREVCSSVFETELEAWAALREIRLEEVRWATDRAMEADCAIAKLVAANS